MTIAFAMLSLWMISGVLWPIEVMPEVLRQIAVLGPLCQPVIALQSIMLRGWTLNNPIVYNALFLNLFYIFVLSLFDIILLTKLTK